MTITEDLERVSAFITGRKTVQTAEHRISNIFETDLHAEKKGPKLKKKNCWMTLPKTKQRTENKENMF